MNEKTYHRIAYLGPAGVGLGFKLTGMTVIACHSPEEMLSFLRELKETAQHGIIFIDESLAAGQMESISYLNTDALPAILLLPNPIKPQNLSAKSLKKLIVKAVGSDILK